MTAYSNLSSDYLTTLFHLSDDPHLFYLIGYDYRNHNSIRLATRSTRLTKKMILIYIYIISSTPNLFRSSWEALYRRFVYFLPFTSSKRKSEERISPLQEKLLSTVEFVKDNVEIRSIEGKEGRGNAIISQKKEWKWREEGQKKEGRNERIEASCRSLSRSCVVINSKWNKVDNKVGVLQRNIRWHLIGDITCKVVKN